MAAGQRFRMVIDPVNKAVPWARSPVPAERQIIGLGPITLAVPRLDRTERVLGVLSIVLLGFVLVALVRGAAHWNQLPWTLWLHLATMMAMTWLWSALNLQRLESRLHSSHSQ